jgi:hypothetical protein
MKRYILIVLLAVVFSIPTMGQMVWSKAYQQYFDQYKDLAIEQMIRYHIPASITLAQGVLGVGCWQE